MAERDLTVIISSHNLRELEDFCDSVILMHQGDVLLAKSLDEAKANCFRVQCVLKKEEDMEVLKSRLSVQNLKRHDTMYTFTAECTKEQMNQAMEGIETAYFELKSLSLEELFIMETEVAGYDIKNILLEAM